MAEPATEFVKQMYVRKDHLRALQLKSAIAKVRKWQGEYKERLAHMAEAVKGNRFIMFVQDVWYDYRTGLLLPKFDKKLCPSYAIENFGEYVRTKSAKDFSVSFAGFAGRVITAEECQQIFSKKAKYPYKISDNTDNFIPDFVGNYILTSSSWQEYSNPSKKGEAYASNYSQYDSFNKKFRRLFVVSEGCEKWCGKSQTKQLLVKFKKKSSHGGFMSFLLWDPVFEDVCGNVKTGTLIPVYPLTDPHEAASPQSSEEVTELGMKLFAQRLIPESMDEADKERMPYLFDTYPMFEKYLPLDEDSLAGKLSLATQKEKDALGIGEADGELPVETANEMLLGSDTRRANLSPYPARLLTDINMGHWELYEDIKNPPSDSVTVPLEREIVARPPQMDVKASGICAIDFGTKSTVVVCRNRDERLLRVGKTDYHKKPTMEDYENPTVIEMRDIVGFRKAYDERDGRPFTEWEQITVSHQAQGRLLENEGQSIYQSVFSELKQWANEKKRNRRMRDQKGHAFLLPAYEELDERDFDPIEIYAYYLGLCINNMVNGIYLEYILSFPVNYEKSVRARLRDSFERGIKKSLPPSILHDKELMEDFRVYAGASEPAAYASCALKELGKEQAEMRPTEERPIYYGVFDFGGGTTDFDYGIWRLPTADDKGDWNFVIEHFNAGGDVNLGGEKLLHLLAYEVYQSNLNLMREQRIPFALPEGCRSFVGSEMLLTETDAAYLNRHILSKLLRRVWEEQPDYEKMSDQPQEVNLYRDADMVSVSLKVAVPKLRKILKKHIGIGVRNFFVGLLQAFRDKRAPVYHILLAGNSCKSSLVQDAFQEEMKRQEKNIKLGAMETQGQEKNFDGIFCLHLPLGSEKQDKKERNFDRIPTGKTGVAFGLLDCRKGGHDVLVIDHNLSEEKEALFRYYLGYSDRADKFHVLVGKGIGYQEWVPFFYTNDDRFEIYYSSEPRALENQMDITEVPAPKKCRIHYLDGHDEGKIYIRKVAPTRIEYTVAGDDGIKGEEYWAKVESCELEE